MPASFNLEIAIAAWRRPFEHNRTFTPDDLEELEGSLRDRAAALVASGFTEEQAFTRAVRRMGTYGGAEVEYRKVYWSKLKQTHQLIPELAWRFSMLKNYFIVAYRNLKTSKGYTFINVGGLAIGLASFILILLFVQHERSYDRFYGNADRIYRILKRHPGANFHGLDSWASTPGQLAAALKKEFAEVTAATTIDDQTALLGVGKRYSLETGLWADAHFFDVFAYPMLRGNPETALSRPGAIVLSLSLARKLFGNQDPIGQTVQYEKQDPYTVTGIIPDLPENSSLRYTFVTSIYSQGDYRQNLAANTWNSNFFTFFTLDDPSHETRLQAKMPSFVHRYVPDQGPAGRGQYLLQSLKNVHLHSKFNFDLAFTGDVRFVYLFSAIALTILLLACINYTNLAVARSIQRTREVGLRKVVGAARGQLIGQFLGESVLLTLLALVLALGLVHLLLPFFSGMMERPLHVDYFDRDALVPEMLALVVFVGLFSGSYPAVYLSSLQPIHALAGKTNKRGQRFTLQRMLIVGQYIVSITLLAGSLVVYKQMSFVRHTNVGYDREHVVTMQVPDPAVNRNYPAFREEWLRHTRVASVSSSSALPTYFVSNNGISGWEGSRGDEHLDVYIAFADYGFLDVFGIQLVAGRNFSPDFPGDTTSAALINEAAAHALGWAPEEAVGKHFIHNDSERTIVGVVKNFHTQSLHQPIEPTVIRFGTGSFYSVRVIPGDLPGTIGLFQQTIERYTPYPFDYQFLDQVFDRLYKADLRMGETFGFFTLLALVIASLGLFGLAAFSSEQRTKEVGIRKSLGAGTVHIVTLLSKDFLKLVAIASIVAIPLAWFIMVHWLSDFAYRIELGPGLFFLAGALSLCVAFLAVSYQAIRAAVTDPVKSLRYE